MEALQCILWQRFGDWCHAKDYAVVDCTAVQETMAQLRRKQTAENMQVVSADRDFCKLFMPIKSFANS